MSIQDSKKKFQDVIPSAALHPEEHIFGASVHTK
jgi:hypothetical protein